MTQAICHKCGEEKAGALLRCGACGITPSVEGALALSLALSEHLCSREQLIRHAREIKHGLRPTIERQRLVEALEALKDPQLLAMMGLDRSQTQRSTQPTHPSPHYDATAVDRKTAVDRVDQNPCTTTDTGLHRTPFWLLGATVRDDRQRIVALAEEKSLELDHELCQKARAALTNPRARLAAEVTWLPGVSPRKANQLMQLLSQDAIAVRTQSGIPTLANANLMAAAFELLDDAMLPSDVANFIRELARLVEALSPEDVLRDINEDREISRFPEVKSVEEVEEELVERKRHFRDVIKGALNRMAPKDLVDVVTVVVNTATENGESHAPELIDELVDTYEVESQGFLQKESENAMHLIQAARDAAKHGEAAVKPLIDKLDTVARNWDKVAQPIQLSAKARGIEHRPSRDLALSIRSLAVDLCNEHDMLAQSRRMTDLLKEVFADLPEVAERAEQDAEALDNIFRNRKEGEARRKEWEEEITFEAEVGLVFKDALKISPAGLEWKGKRYPLESITGIRWGAVRHSVNGIPTGTNYTIAFGDSRTVAVVELKREAVYLKFVDKLWRAVGVRLLVDLLEALRAGRQISIGESVVEDSAITLTKHKLLGSNERVRLGWHQVHVWSANGSFYVGAKDEKKTYIAFSYIATPNAHVLEHAIRMGFKKGIDKLSESLNDS
jgi:hypothetical protein